MSNGPSRAYLAALGACLAGCSAAPPAPAKQESRFKPLASASAGPREACEEELADLRKILGDSRPTPSPCPPGTRRRGDRCEELEVVCPPGSTRVGPTCVGDVICPDATAWNGRGCAAGAAGAASGAPPPGPSPAEACFFKLNAIPQASVLLDGVSVGPTPRLNVPAAPGTHTLVFIADNGGKKAVTATCKAGEVKIVVVKF